MSREDISFKTSDGVTLRGWFYIPTVSKPGPHPCLILSHGFSCLKEMDLDLFASHFSTHLPLSCLVYDHRGFGSSDTLPGQPRQEVIPSIQRSDTQDAITYAQSRDDVDEEKIGIWGSSYSAGHALHIGAVDRRVKAVLAQNPFVSGWTQIMRAVRPDFIRGMVAGFQADRLGRMKGEAPIMIPVTVPDPFTPSAIVGTVTHEWFTGWSKRIDWKNEVTARSGEEVLGNNPGLYIHMLSPTPLLMSISANDTVCPTDASLKVYANALEPKELHILPGGHFEAYSGPNFELNVGHQVEFLKKTLCA